MASDKPDDGARVEAETVDSLTLPELAYWLSKARGGTSLFIVELRQLGSILDSQSAATLDNRTLPEAAVLEALAVSLRSAMAYYGFKP
jgi:hypothetical protein